MLILGDHYSVHHLDRVEGRVWKQDHQDFVDKIILMQQYMYAGLVPERLGVQARLILARISLLRSVALRTSLRVCMQSIPSQRYHQQRSCHLSTTTVYWTFDSKWVQEIRNSDAREEVLLNRFVAHVEEHN